MQKKIGIIGAGVVGSAMATVLSRLGYEITGVHDIKPESTKALAEKISCTAFDDSAALAATADLIFITTNDSAIAQVVDDLADRGAINDGHVLIHMSGAHASDIMENARVLGTHLLSLHPLQSFASLEQAIDNLPGSVFSIEGDRDSYNIAVCIVETLKGEYFFIDKQSKPLYHAGACVVSNYLVSLFDLGVKLLKSTGIPSELTVKALMPLVKGTIHNLETLEVEQALTGPISRGDITTVEEHLTCMKQSVPGLLPLYCTLGQFTVPIAQAKGTAAPEKLAAFAELFSRELATENV